MKQTLVIALTLGISACLSVPAISMAAPPNTSTSTSNGNQTGFNSTTTQGNSGKTSPTTGAASSNGTQTTSGPNGQIKQGNTTCNNCTTTGPGNSSK